MTATQLIYRSLRLCKDGLVRPGRTASPEQLTDGLARLNDMIDAWGIERLTIFFVLRTEKTLADATASYTIGTGGSINIVRPASIESAGLILDTAADPTTEKPIHIFTDQEWQSIKQKGLTSTLVSGIYYDKQWTAGLATIYVWPVPTIGTTALILYTLQALTAFADLTTSYTFPPGYAEAIGYQLALRLAPEFGGLTDPATEKNATVALARLKRGNIRPVEVELDRATPGLHAGNVFDWRTGDVR